MLRTTWFRQRTHTMAKTGLSRRLMRRRPELESLEDRLTPTLFTTNILGAPLESPEGTAIALTNEVTPVTAGEVVDVSTYAWSVTKDGAPFATGTAAAFSFTPDDNGVYEVSLTITDSVGDTATATPVTITATNVAPTASITGPTVVVPGQNATFTLTATDPSTADQAAGFAFAVDWESDGVIDETIAATAGNGAGVAVSHTFTTTGDITVTVTATDKDGGVSAPATTAVGVETVAIGDDPANPGQTALFVGGTTGNDKIQFLPGGSQGGVRVRVNGVDQGSFAPTGSIVVFAQDGNDNIQLAGSIRLSARLHGDAGNDRIKAAKGPSVLDGGEGDDMLIGGKANDVIIAGAGADRVVGGPGEDVIIAGSMDSDDTALGMLLNDWNAPGTYSMRVTDLAATLTAAVTEDGMADQLTGASGLDWFITTDPLDQVTGMTPGEILNVPTTPPTTGGGHGNGHGNGGTHGGGNGGGHGNGHGNH